MHKARIGIFGASGYAGMELTRIAAAHPGLKISFLASERFVGQSVETFTGVTGPVGKLSYVAFDAAVEACKECDAVLLATPAEASLELVPKLLQLGVKVVDLSGAFRLEDSELHSKFYGGSRSEAGPYGLPELFRDALKAQKFVSNPGCYPTAAALALAPLLDKKLIQPHGLIIDALSGASGAGRKSSEEYSLSELHDDVKAYKVLSHQHTPEITQTLSRAAGTKLSVTFTPHLLPIPRGILSTAYAQATSPLTSAELTAALKDAYKGESFVRVMDKPEQVTLHAVVGTNLCAIGAATDGKQVVVVSAIDNLVKGAAGQALQNLNLMLGLEETAGLSSLRRFH